MQARESRKTTRLRHAGYLILALLLGPQVASACGDERAAAEGYIFQRLLPLGMEFLRVGVEQHPVHVLVSAMPEGANGMRRPPGPELQLLSATGRPLSHLPRSVEFRVTMSAMRDDFIEMEPYAVLAESEQDLNTFLLAMTFRLRVYHGLQNYDVKPSAVRLIGMPADIPYPERIYSVLFDVGEIPLDRRLVFEIHSRAGERLGRFHLEYFF